MPSTLTLKTDRGDAKTLLAFNLHESAIKSLAGFTVHVTAGKLPLPVERTPLASSR